MSSDYWLSSDTILYAPKQQIGEYVETQGFNVPRRFETFDEAFDVVRAAGTILIRSEHPDEYDSASGLLQSFKLDPTIVEESRRVFKDFGSFDVDEQVSLSANRGAHVPAKYSDGPGYSQMEDVVLGVALDTPTDITIQRLKRLVAQNGPVRRYADLTGRNLREFMDEADFSFWEYIPGKNVTVVADSAIDDRYHVLANGARRKGAPYYYGWQIADERGNFVDGKEDDDILMPQTMASLIQTYEAIRNLPRFATENCPIIELQLKDDGQIWFLQYHRTRDFKPAGEPLNPIDFPAEEGWQKADGIRGALEAPSALKTALWYPNHYGSPQRVVRQLPNIEDASTDWHWDWALSEVLSPRRLTYISDERKDRLYDTLAAAHAPRSKWFKPLAAIALNDKGLENLVPEAIKKDISATVHREDDFAQVVLDVAVDGNSGYVRLNPDSEQPYYEVY